MHCKTISWMHFLMNYLLKIQGHINTTYGLSLIVFFFVILGGCNITFFLDLLVVDPNSCYFVIILIIKLFLLLMIIKCKNTKVAKGY